MEQRNFNARKLSAGGGFQNKTLSLAGEEEQLWENEGVSQNFYSASEGEVELGTLLEGESFIGNVDPGDNDLDGAAKNSLSFRRNSDGNDCFFTDLADNPADRESVGSNSVDRSGSLTAASADDAAEVNFNFGSTKGIIRLAAEEEEGEEQVSDDDPADRESVGSNKTPSDGCPSIHAEMEDLMLALNSGDLSEVDDEEALSDGCPSIHAEMEDLMLAFNAWDLSEVDDEETSSDGCPSIHAEMEDLMLSFNAWDLSEVDDEEENEDDEQWEEVPGEEAVTADDAAEVNFNFGSTKGISRPAAEEEEEEEQVSDDDPADWESVGSNTTPPDGWPSVQGEEAVTADAAAEVNFNFGSTKGISQPAAEEEEEEQVSDDDPADWESVGSNTTPPDGWPSAQGEEAVTAASADAPAEDVDEEEDEEGESFAENNDDFGARPASRAAVESLIPMQIGQEDFCVICLDPLSVGEFAIPLSCGHSYHAGCILDWLKLGNSCPSCRYELPEDPAYEE